MATSYTSNKKIGALDSASTPLAATNEIVINQNGDILKTPLSAVEAKVFDAKTQKTTPTGTEVTIVRQTDGSLRQVPLANIVPALNITNAQISNSAGIEDTKLATINTAGKVTNNAVQATPAISGGAYSNALGANKIVTRDGSGNFAAGTITATLSGNASTATILQTGRTLAMTGDVTYTSPSFNGSANVTAASTIANNAVTTAKISDDAVTFAKIQNSAAAGLSVVGRSAASAGDFAEINAATDGHALRRSGSSLGFGQIGSAGIATGAVTATELASNAVTTVKILDANVTGSKLENSGVAAGTYNDNAAQVRPFTVDVKGRVTSVGAAVPIEIDAAAVTGTPFKRPVTVATTANLTATYDNGSSGVGATLTNSGTLGQLSVDGFANFSAGVSRVLVKNQTTAAQNGIYTVTDRGSPTEAWVLTRATDSDQAGEAAGAVVTVNRGTANGGNAYTTNFKSTSTVGTAAQNWFQVVTTGDSQTVSTTMIADSNVTTAKIADANVTTAKVANDAIDNTKIRNSAALSVIGRSANSTGDPADITAGTDGHVLRRSGTALGFGQVATAGITDSAVTTAKIADANVTTAKIADSNVTTAKLASDTQQGLIPAGAVMPFARTTPPAGWLEANGDVVPNGTGTVQGVTANFAALRAAVGSSFGAAGTLPNLNGVFVRGRGQQLVGANTYMGTYGSTQGDQFRRHTHAISTGNSAASSSDFTDPVRGSGTGSMNSRGGGGAGGLLVLDDTDVGLNAGSITATGNGTTTVSAPDYTIKYTGGPSTNTGSSLPGETRPANVSLLYCIKY